MKKFIAAAWKIFCIVLTLIFLVSCLSSIIAPSDFSYIVFFSLAFPYLFLLQVVFGIISIFVDKKLGAVMLLLLSFSYFNLKNTLAINTGVAWQQQKADNTLRIMTWNVENFVTLNPQSDSIAKVRVEMLNLINQQNPDVICFQEYKNVEHGRRRVSVQNELDSLGYKYYFCSNDVYLKIDKRTVTGGAAIYSKQPLYNTGAVKIRTEFMNESLAHADVMLNNKLLRIYTAHLASFSLYPSIAVSNLDEQEIYTITYNRKSTVQQQLKETELLHEHQVKLIRKNMNKSVYPAVYCGDINTTPASYNYRVLKDGLQDSFLKKGFGLGSTFYKILPTLRIDVCLADTAFNIKQCKVVRQKLSDHYPVITDIQWK